MPKRGLLLGSDGAGAVTDRVGRPRPRGELRGCDRNALRKDLGARNLGPGARPKMNVNSYGPDRDVTPPPHRHAGVLERAAKSMEEGSVERPGGG